MTESMRRARAVLLLFLAAILSTGVGAGIGSHTFAWAGADELFGDGQGHPPDFIGVVRDVKNRKPIPGARVTAVIAGHGAGTTTYSDGEGRFRIEGFSDDTNRDTVQIECTKPGYKVVNVIRRKLSPDPAVPVEVECLNEPG